MPHPGVRQSYRARYDCLTLTWMPTHKESDWASTSASSMSVYSRIPEPEDTRTAKLLLILINCHYFAVCAAGTCRHLHGPHSHEVENRSASAAASCRSPL